jgi:hypothetical protein
MTNTQSTQAAQFPNLAEISESYHVKPLKAFTEDTQEGKYLVRKIEKGTGKPSQGCIIPALTSEQATTALENDSVFSGYVSWLQDQVEECCKARIESGAKFLIDSDFNLEAVSSYLQAKEVSQGRVSKEKIVAWFNSSMVPALQAAFTKQLGEAATPEKLTHICNAYRGNFEKLAKRDVFLHEQVKANLNSALKLVPNSLLAKYCTDKINAPIPDIGLDKDMMALQ